MFDAKCERGIRKLLYWGGDHRFSAIASSIPA